MGSALIPSRCQIVLPQLPASTHSSRRWITLHAWGKRKDGYEGARSTPGRMQDQHPSEASNEGRKAKGLCQSGTSCPENRTGKVVKAFPASALKKSEGGGCGGPLAY